MQYYFNFFAVENKNLQFLVSLLDATGVSKAGLASMMGCSTQNLFTFLKRDDMRLSTAQEMAGMLGYTLSFSLEKEGKSTSNVIVNIEPLIGENGLKRLAFLRAALALYGIDRKDLADKLGISYTGVNRWFRIDDISVSYIFRIATLYDLKVNITASPNKTATKIS